jgi:hypothetical protein
MPATCKVVGLWLCFYAMIDFFMLPFAQAHILYVILQEVMTTSNILLQHIAKEQGQRAFFMLRFKKQSR